ncbi:MAG TPA: phosphoribosyltransferase [Solirubrobacteraceae bacterium]|nr:phosphoribosyltransferase [Solirubrobacteraceae bacterium]
MTRLRPRKFADRHAAGLRLAEHLADYHDRENLVVVGLPRGGVPVAYEVAAALRAPLDVLLVRKLGVPGQEELAFGAIASGGVRVLNDDVVAEAHLSQPRIDQIAAEQQLELRRREQLYRGGRPPVQVRGRVALVVDDGLATGATMRAAVRALRKLGASSVVVAVPTAARATCEELARDADAIVCASTPDPFVAVGIWYRDFAPTTDEEVRDLLVRASEP